MYILNKGEQNMSTLTTTKKVLLSSPSNLKFVSKKTFYKHNKPNTNQQYLLVYPPKTHYPLPNYLMSHFNNPPSYLLVTTLQNFRKAVQRNKKLDVHPIVAAPTTHVNLYTKPHVFRKLPHTYNSNYTVALIPQSKQKQFYNAYTLNNNVKYL